MAGPQVAVCPDRHWEALADPHSSLILGAVLCPQVLGRNLEALVGRAQEVKEGMKDDFVSVEHLLLAFCDDTRFGLALLKGDQLTKQNLEAAIKEVQSHPCGLPVIALCVACAEWWREYVSTGRATSYVIQARFDVVKHPLPGSWA